jgi:hypothetical protein
MIINKENNFSLYSKCVLVFFLFTLIKVYSQTIPLSDKQTNPEKKAKLLSQDTKEYLKAKKLKVSEITRFTSGYNEDGSLPEKKTFAEKIYFDKNGNRIEHIILKPDSLLDNRQTFSYDTKGNVVVAEVYNDNDNLIFRRESIYNEKSNEVTRVFSEAKTKGKSKAEMKYNDADQLEEVITYKPNGQINTLVKIFYENGRMILTENQNAKGATVEESILSYDSDGNIIQELITNGKDSVAFKYEYNENGFLASIKYADATRFMDYDENGNIIEDRQFLLTGEREFLVRFNYYDNGLIKEEIRYSVDDKPNFYSIFEYIFYK